MFWSVRCTVKFVTNMLHGESKRVTLPWFIYHPLILTGVGHVCLSVHIMCISVQPSMVVLQRKPNSLEKCMKITESHFGFMRCNQQINHIIINTSFILPSIKSSKTHQSRSRRPDIVSKLPIDTYSLFRERDECKSRGERDL